MLKLQSAPPRRTINWYRVATRIVIGAVIAFVLFCLVVSFPVVWEWASGNGSEPIFSFVASRGYGWEMQIAAAVGAAMVLPLTIAAIALALYLIYLISLLIGTVVDWWCGKIRESDRKAKEHSGYRD